MKTSRGSSPVALGGSILAVFLFASIGFAQGFKQIHLCGGSDEQPQTLIQNPADGFFYGTSLGGNGFGTVFKMDTSGNVTILHSLAGPPNDGTSPKAGLFLNPSDGLLYGTAYTGGGFSHIVGGVFKLDTSGGSYSFQSQPLDPLGYCTTTGTNPQASFFKANDGNFYVPMSLCGGGSYTGVIDRIDTSLNETQIAGFDTTADGYEVPVGHLVQGSDDNLYAVCQTANPAPSASGLIYRVGLGGGSIDPVHLFVNGEGDVSDVPSPLVLASDGNFYGTTYSATDLAGDDLGTGTIFRVGTDGTFATLHNFSPADGPDGCAPEAGLVQASDGYLYGTTTDGGKSHYGTIFRIDMNGNYQFLIDLADTSSGSCNPAAELVQGMDGKLYGTTPCGGVGTIFTVDLTQTIASLSPNSGPASGGTAVTINGSGFVAGATLTLAGVIPTTVSVPDATHIDVTTGEIFSPGPGTVGDVLITLPDTTVIIMYNGWFYDFDDVPAGSQFHDYIRKIVQAHITAGCGGGDYCPGSPVTRAQMAVFLLKAEHGAAYQPPACTGVFGDVPCPSQYANWIEELAAEGITGGCGGGDYCPGNPVTRAQMAVFLLKTQHGEGYAPPACVGVFLDVPCPSPFADWIEQLAAEGVTGGCGDGDYCPGNPVNRGQMAVFLSKTFNLP